MSRRCEGTTHAGNQCRRPCPPGDMYCSVHNDDARSQRQQEKLDIIEALSRVFAYGAAADACHISVPHLNWLRNEDPDFEAACHAARAHALDIVEASMIRRARGFNHTEQVKELRTVGEGPDQREELVVVRETTRHHFSDKAAEALLRSERPQYRHTYNAPVPPRQDTPVEADARAVMNDPKLAAKMDEVLAALDEEA